MALTYDPIFAADPNNAANVAANASIIIFDPNDPGKSPITITDVTGSPLPNPITVNKNGFGPAFQHATLDRVGWFGAGFTGYFTSYEGMKAVAVEAAADAQAAAVNAGTAALAEVAARIATGEFMGAPGQDGANVLPTDTAIKDAIATPGTETATALSAKIGDQVAPVSAAVDTLGKRASDAITSWWCTPRAHYDDLRKRVYFSGVSRGGLQHVGYFDLREKTAHTFPVGTYEADDHNTPAMLIEDDKPPIVLIPRHGQAAVVRYRKGTAAHALDTLGPERTIPFVGLTSYGHIMRQTGTNNIAVLTRDDGLQAGLAVSRSTDYGETWEAPFRLFGSGYVHFRQYGNTIHGFMSTHATTSNGGATYFRIDALTGDIYNAHAPTTVIANLWTTTAVISSGSLTVAQSHTNADTPYNTSRAFDIGPGGSIAIMDFHKDTRAQGGVYKVLRHKVGGVWAHEILTTSGVPLGYNESAYVGGMAFGATDNEIYLCRENAGTWTLERWTTTGAAQPWSKAETIETRTDGRKLGRPIMPRKGEAFGRLVYGEYHKYDALNFWDYYADQMVR